MKTAWSLLVNMKRLKKSDMWPLLLSVITTAIAWAKREPGGLQAFFGAVMALLVYLLATYYTPEMIAGPAYRAGAVSSASLKLVIPQWEKLETVGQATLEVAQCEYFKGLDSDDAS